MAEIRCPMCGKPNPAELDNCQLCGARLKPLEAPSISSSPPIQAGEEPTKKATSELDRASMAGRESIQAGDEPTKKNTSDLERALPPWLRSLREGSTQPAAEDAPQAGTGPDLPFEPAADAAAEEKPADWLSGLGAQQEQDEEIPDWLAGIRNKMQDDGVPAAEEPITHPLGGAEGLDRLSGIPAQEVPGLPGYEIASGRLEAEISEPAPAEGLPDWLKNLQADSAPSGEGMAPASSGQEGEDVSQWLSSLSADQPAQPSPAEAGTGETPDWLSRLDGGPAAQPPAPAEPAPAEAVPGELPDWLSRLDGGGAAQPPASAEPAAAEAAPGEMPDWLSKLDSGAAAQPPASAEPSPTAAPDWLSDFQAQAAAPQPASSGVTGWLSSPEVKPDAEPPAQEEAAPDWLSQLGQPAAAPTAGEETALPAWMSAGEEAPAPEPPVPAEDVPDWLKGTQPQEEAAPAVDAGATPFLAAAQAAPAQAAEMPDWLSKLQPDGAPAGAGPEPVPPAPEMGTPADSAPAFVLESEAETPAGSGEAVFSMENPDWLSSLKPEEGQAAQAPAAEAAGGPSGDISPADLPSWVQAMRPVESVVSQDKASQPEEEMAAEEQGPLAGLRGVLPAGPGLGSIRKPPAYSIKLQVNESQQRYAAFLEQMVSKENQARPAAAKRGINPSRLLRILIAVVLLLAVGLAAFLGPLTAPATDIPPEVVATFNLIGSLPPASPVLVVIDYQPALAGELEAAASPLFDQLLFSGTRLTFVSTSIAGPALAEHFLDATQGTHNYQSGLQYVNLGYLPGGPTGVVYFAADPASAMPDGPLMAPWEQAPLDGVDGMGDFAALVVMTDDADTGRAWIEQLRYAGSPLTDLPMVMIISAQAEPMIRPFYDSGQVDGLLTGLAGGRYYEQLIQRPGIAQGYWSAFSAGILVAILAILVGGAWSALDAWRARKPVVEGEA